MEIAIQQLVNSIILTKEKTMKNKIKLLISILFIGMFVNIGDVYAGHVDSIDIFFNRPDSGYFSSDYFSGDKLAENELNIFKADNYKSVGVGVVKDIDTLKNEIKSVVFTSSKGVYSMEASVKITSYNGDLYEIDTIITTKLSSTITNGYKIHADQTGNIWVATLEGLQKYDGSKWFLSKFGESIPNEKIAEITSDKNNRLLVVTNKGGYFIENSVVTEYPLYVTNETDSVRYGVYDTTNRPLLATTQGVFYLENEKWELISFFKDSVYSTLYEDTLYNGDSIYYRGADTKSIFVDKNTGELYFTSTFFYDIGSFYSPYVFFYDMIRYYYYYELNNDKNISSIFKLKDIDSSPVAEVIYPYNKDYIPMGLTTMVNINNFVSFKVNNLICHVYQEESSVMSDGVEYGGYTVFFLKDISTGENRVYNLQDWYGGNNCGGYNIKQKFFFMGDFAWALLNGGELAFIINQKNSSITASALYVKELTELNSDKLKIYPNPVSDIINIESSIDGEIFIVTKTAKIVTKVKNNKTNIKNLPKGIYYGVVKENGEIKAVKSFYKR